MVQATLVAAIAAAVQFSAPVLLSAEEGGRPALTIEIDGAIGPATARYVKEALTTAGERRVDVIILRLNTPGVLATSMRTGRGEVTLIRSDFLAGFTWAPSSSAHQSGLLRGGSQ